MSVITVPIPYAVQRIETPLLQESAWLNPPRCGAGPDTRISVGSDAGEEPLVHSSRTPIS